MRAGVVALGGVLAVIGVLLSGFVIPIEHFVELPFIGPIPVGTTYIEFSQIGMLVLIVGILVLVVGIVLPKDEAPA